jgi:hypothetical protein
MPHTVVWRRLTALKKAEIPLHKGAPAVCLDA